MDKPKDLDEDNEAPTVEKLFAGASFEQSRRSSQPGLCLAEAAQPSGSAPTSDGNASGANDTHATADTSSNSLPGASAPVSGGLPPGVPPPDGEKPGEYML